MARRLILAFVLALALAVALVLAFGSSASVNVAVRVSVNVSISASANASVSVPLFQLGSRFCCAVLCCVVHTASYQIAPSCSLVARRHPCRWFVVRYYYYYYYYYFNNCCSITIPHPLLLSINKRTPG